MVHLKNKVISIMRLQKFRTSYSRIGLTMPPDLWALTCDAQNAFKTCCGAGLRAYSVKNPIVDPIFNLITYHTNNKS